jgi:hypothetical protein
MHDLMKILKAKQYRLSEPKATMLSLFLHIHIVHISKNVSNPLIHSYFVTLVIMCLYVITHEVVTIRL